ncbi:MAG: protein kinase [Candidatus Eisenbacteria bacterium]|uniref:Protein kinase n=1 Tax=Eiseniibacteriota bacterium TaxID=2212470 RepID=A0A956LVK8_UNCEI|nr:protein kinase [Candidatus Eisenbacteria bacterium]
MSLAPGTRLGPYEIDHLLGAGGMGEVYLAVDSRLGRQVALKVLPPALSGNPAAKARFEREARTVSSLNHAHICTLHDIGSENGVDFLVMELLEGWTLAEVLHHGPLAFPYALEVAAQIADALDSAHQHGLIHRDLKPGNVMISDEGQAKVLDFGLARDVRDAEPGTSAAGGTGSDANAPRSGRRPPSILGRPSPGSRPPVPRSGPGSGTSSLPPTQPQDVTEMFLATALESHDPTLSLAATHGGLILGTPAYMSPEQARGEPTDRRTDVWAFGVVLFEMLSGHRPFGATNTAQMLMELQSVGPDWSRLPSQIPEAITRLLHFCLERDARRRRKDLGDVRLELLHEAAALGRRKRSGTGWRLGVQAPPRHFLEVLDGALLTLARDGRTVAFVAHEKGSGRIFVRRFDAFETRPLPGTEGAIDPFFSPDGQWIGFFAGGKLRKISVRGGANQALCEASYTRGASWSPDGTFILFTPGPTTGLHRVPTNGGPADPVTQVMPERGERTHRWPEVLPGGQSAIFTVGGAANPSNFEDASIAVVDLGSGERRTLYQGASMARYAASGHLVLAVGNTLHAVPFDLQRLQITGEPIPVFEGVRTDLSNGCSDFAVSDSGVLVTIGGRHARDQLRLVWVDRSGRLDPLSFPLRAWRYPRIAPDGERVALNVGIGKGSQDDVWTLDLARGTMNRLTFNGGSFTPVWSPDGRRVAYGIAVEGPERLVSRNADGGGDEVPVVTPGVPLFATDWTPDGSAVLYTRLWGSKLTIWLARPGEEPVSPGESPLLGWGARFSPDGRWFVYASETSGRPEIYVQAFEEIGSSPGGRWQISEEGGIEPIWSPAGDEIFYRIGDRMMAVPVGTTPSFRAERPRVLFEGLRNMSLPPFPVCNYDVSSDGQRFLMIEDINRESAPTAIQVAFDWFDELGPA